MWTYVYGYNNDPNNPYVNSLAVGARHRGPRRDHPIQRLHEGVHTDHDSTHPAVLVHARHGCCPFLLDDGWQRAGPGGWTGL